MKAKLKDSFLILSLILSSCLISLVGLYWYHNYNMTNDSYDALEKLIPITYAMNGIHDGYVVSSCSDIIDIARNYLNTASEPVKDHTNTDLVLAHYEQMHYQIEEALIIHTSDAIVVGSAPEEDVAEELSAEPVPLEEELPVVPLEFTCATDDYLDDAVFIGDSRTVGIQMYSGITNASFLCATSMTVYGYTNPVVNYNGMRTSIKDALSKNKFGKVYIMLGINECTNQVDQWFAAYKAIIDDIRAMQPDAIIFVEANLLVTKEKSSLNTRINNTNLQAINDSIASLANGTDIFYIDINESSLCQDNALIADYTWDHVHIMAQYYTIWKEFILNHAIKGCD